MSDHAAFTVPLRLLDERVFVSLGILRVGACLEAAGYVVEHLDLSGIENFEEAAADHAARSSATIFGLTATTPQMPAAARIVGAIREARLLTTGSTGKRRERLNSDSSDFSDCTDLPARIILGGPHVTLVNAAYKRERKLGINGRAAKAFHRLASMFDVLVAGDGDDAVFGAISPDPPKLIDADDALSPLFLTNKRYDEIPFPARHLVDMESYHYSIDGERATSMIAQLGCPFACGFCGGRESPMLRRIRTRTTESIVREIVGLHDTYGFRGFQMYDDELNVNKSIVELMEAIHDAQVGLGVEFRLRGFIKSQLFTDAQAAAMYRAGFRWILVGFESGSPRILENINKRATREENTRCMEIARRHGLKVKALMSMGHPGESAETVAATRDWLLEVRPDDFDVTIITTYPGTPYFDHAVETDPGIWTYTFPKNGDRLHSYELDHTITEDFYKGMVGEYKSFVFTDYLSADELVALRDELENDVRARLGIPFNHGQPGVRYEASMGQLPGHILRQSNELVGV